MALAFNAGFLIDDVGNAVTFGNGLGGTFWHACTAGDAIFGNFHGHGCCSVYEFGAALN